MLPDPFHLGHGPQGESLWAQCLIHTHAMEEALVTATEGHKGGLSVALAWCVKENLTQSWTPPEYSGFAMVQGVSAV